MSSGLRTQFCIGVTRLTNPELLDVVRAEDTVLHWSDQVNKSRAFRYRQGWLICRKSLLVACFSCDSFWLSVGGAVFVANVLFWLLPTSGSEIFGHFCSFCDSDTLQAVPLGYIGNTYTLESLMYKKIIKMDRYHFIKANFMNNPWKISIHPFPKLIVLWFSKWGSCDNLKGLVLFSNYNKYLFKYRLIWMV